MKTIYLVRHGESENNATGRYNTADAGLSEVGKKQILSIAERCTQLLFDTIISSTMRRARETADSISARSSIPVEESDLFVERRMPRVLQGKLKSNPEVQRIQKVIAERFAEPGFRYEDGEGFEDMKARAIQCLTYLENREEERILVVTHGYFMNVLAATVLMGEDLTGKECWRILRSMQVAENTSVSVLRLDEFNIHNSSDGLGTRWQLRVWNDHAHLG